MYDSVGLMCFTNESLRWENLEHVSEKTNLETGLVRYCGKLGNLQITEMENGVSIYGSLPKYFLGNNIETLNRKAVLQAVEKISDETGLNVKDSKLFRFDISSCFILQEDVINYLNLLDDLSRFKKSNMKGTVYYSKGNIELTFYNKTSEMSKKRQAIPVMYKQYKNKVLRYELRYLRGLKKVFGKDIYLKDLTDEAFYIEQIKKWKEYYFNINKKGNLMFNAIAFEDVKAFQEQLMLKGLYALGGPEEVNNMIERSRGGMERYKLKRIKDKIKELKQSKDLTEANPLIKELDSKIKTAIPYYR